MKVSSAPTGIVQETMGWSMTTDGIENIFRMFLERNDISSTTYYPSIMDLGATKGGTETGL